MLNGMLDNLSMIGSEALGALLRPMAASFGDMLFYALISDFIRSEINIFGFEFLSRVSTLVGVCALVVVTIWVVFQGFRIISGQSRDSMMAFVLNIARVSLIVMAATSVGVLSGDLHKFVTKDLPDAITATVTGDGTNTAAKQIDGNLAAMQFALASIDAINIVQDPTLSADKNRAMAMVALGTGGPAMIAGAMLLFYQVALALFVGLGPLFILCLMFDQTKSLFNRWLMYGISTMFSLAVLSAMLAICTKLVLGVAGAFWTTATLSALTGLTLSEGMSTIALQQGGVGLLLTALIITTPTMAGQFFGGVIGTAAQTSGFQGAAGVRPGVGQPAAQNQDYASNNGRAGTSPGQPGYVPPTFDPQSASQGRSVPSQAPQYNNPATNANYGVTTSSQAQGLRGVAPTANPNQGSVGNPSQGGAPQSTTSPRDRGDI